jgi:hypothetical protein
MNTADSIASPARGDEPSATRVMQPATQPATQRHQGAGEPQAASARNATRDNERAKTRDKDRDKTRDTARAGRRGWPSLLGWIAVLAVLAGTWHSADMRPLDLISDSANMGQFAKDFFPPDFTE